ncbi:cytochrome P450 [Kitasatospora sp. NPDC059795]|uniref:cytochrome P450 n=1 Tax=Kitasatospora sp. NPDC059795 TaxID=3346949 RepID=UPI003668A1E4
MITETLRLYPPTWLLSRRAVRNVGWPAARPGRSRCALQPVRPPARSHVFPTPDAFAPFRWLPERVTSLQRESFFVFGASRRKCIGDVLGMSGATITVAMLTSRWDLHHRGIGRDRRIRPHAELTPPPTPVAVRPRNAERAPTGSSGTTPRPAH